MHKESNEKQIIIVRNCKKERKSREKRQIYSVLWHSIRNTQYFLQYLIYVEEHSYCNAILDKSILLPSISLYKNCLGKGERRAK